MRFFDEEDFDAFHESKATSHDEAVISDRKVVVEKFRKLHDGQTLRGNGLGSFVKNYGLYPHWRAEHLTNVYWPLPIANGGWVDYLRMGYGKQKLFIDELAKKSGVFSELNSHGTYYHMAFHYITQVQLSINQWTWGISLHIDRNAWLEQRNLLLKVSENKQRVILHHLIDDLIETGFMPGLYVHSSDDWTEYNNGDEFIDHFVHLVSEKQLVSMEVGVRLDPDEPENDANEIVGFIQSRLEDLIPLYNFVSWHPKSNNYLKL